MTVGLSAANLANGWLTAIRGTGATSFTALTSQFAKLHVGDPGAAGANNAAAGDATRKAVNFAAPSAGSMSLTGTAPVWTNGGTSETLSHISVWDASSAGNFDYSAALSATQAWASGNTFTLTALTFSLTPIAA